MFRKITLAALTAAILTPAASQAVPVNLITDGGFEAGGAAWNINDGAVATDPAGAYEGNNFLWFTLSSDGTGNATQSVTLPSTGTYEFGAWIKFLTTEAAGNWDQIQMSIFGAGVNEVVGTDPGNNTGAVSPSGFGAVESGWIKISDRFTYSGSGSGLVNLSLQNFSPYTTIAAFDNAYIAPVPLPASALLLLGGLGGLGLMRRRRKAA